MKRCVIHWTAGTHTPSGLDKEHYHFIIAGDGVVHPGKHPVSANAAPIKGKYAAHTKNLNSDSIGISLAAMAGAVERPFSAGKYPITKAQESALTQLVSDLCEKYSIPITRETVLTHAEVQPTLGVKQSGKWDVAWLPGMAAAGNPVTVGDILRQRIINHREDKPKPRSSFIATIMEIIKGLLK